ncbi:4-alpha-glucanotransferase [termite gut metagenome]|uniref:4-alpha-glucanotransferase n=1 Tax=termite gut metagenome TaxID=433724 RepID=A0A5J4QPA2_9ZZZZ
MIISFVIEYRIGWNEEIRILGNIPELGDGNPNKAIQLQTYDGFHWTAQIQLSTPRTIEYYYCIYRDNDIVCKEWVGFPRRLQFTAIDKDREYRLIDSWKDIPEESYFYSSAFTESLLAHRKRAGFPKQYRRGLAIKAYAPRITEDYCLAICGNCEAVGNWNLDKAIPMSDVNFPEWQVEIDAAQITFPLEYKFILYNKKEQKAETWENGNNRYLSDPQIKQDEIFVLSNQYPAFNFPVWKGAGVSIPVFSLKSENSFGIGDFGDLKKMIDWAAATNQKVVQILPINDTTMTHTWMDSYPYNAISIYALNPIYLDLSKLGASPDSFQSLFLGKEQVSFSQKQKELNALKSIDYETVEHVKWEYICLIYAQKGNEVLSTANFKRFFETNKEWLQPYAAYSYLRDTYHTANFRDWSKYSVYVAEEIEELCNPKQEHYRQLAIYYYIQFNLHLQLREATTYARRQGVVLKGDIPIGISRDSVEAWAEPYYFNMDGQAGAPPDDFSLTGQNWGFPTYNWEVMEKDNYKWWMKRFQKMSEYFDVYRIDHILGFFRIWEIPAHAVQGLLGQFVPALPMNSKEIEDYGLPFRRDLYLNPYIHEDCLPEIFGLYTEYAKQTFIEPCIGNEGVYKMRVEFDTQRKVEAFFAEKTDGCSIQIREGLYSLISNVLFVTDHKEPDKYHPRITAQSTYIYKKLLTGEEQQAFNRLYDDYYYRRHNEFWYRQAMKRLPQLTQSTRMLVCGEDLGMIPESVSWAMNELRILSLEIQRMSKSPCHEFAYLNEYPYCSVCTISTHDMSTLRGWWEEDTEQTQRYYNTMLQHDGPAPAIATPEICEKVVSSHLHGNSMLCILSLQDWLSIDGSLRDANVNEERINIPANSRHYWRYRMHLTLEQLMSAERLNEKIRKLIMEAERF